ncbi:MAG: aminotransferase class V-fold PLP-dependent enzyme [Acidimicrobiales bacterium]|nr:aminotransferase class V-fold PLP-dependent enzyme [Acidimicrobiales bacterium]
MTSSSTNHDDKPRDPLLVEATTADRNSGLADWRERFVHHDPDEIYLLGNSLGRLPVDTATRIDHAVHNQWANRLIRSWNEGWWDLQLQVGETIAQIIGAESGEVIVSDSTSVNLHKLALAAVRARPGRTKIVTDDLNFGTDYYVLDSVAELCGCDVEIIASDGIHGPVEALCAAFDDNTALVSLSHTTFKSGFTYDLETITSAAHRAGAIVLWDLSHSVGSVDFSVETAGVDLAVGCTYKYLNGGPGAPAFIYVNRSLQKVLSNPVRGWWGHAAPFDFETAYRPTESIRSFHAGTMPILSLAAAEPGIEMVAEVGMERIRQVSVSLMALAERLYDRDLAPLGFQWKTPRDPAVRGSHVALAHPNAWQLSQALIERGKVLLDFRAPDNLRLGLAPLYIGHVDVYEAVARIRRIVESGVWQQYPEERSVVT